MNLEILVRPVATGDRAFLFDLFRALRADRFKVHSDGHPQMAAPVRQQFKAFESALKSRYPEAPHSVILATSAPAGRLIVARTEAAIEVAHIALLPARQRQGIGSFVIENLQREARAAGLPMRCTVPQNNPAGFHFFRALGFRLASQDNAYAHLEWP